MIKVIMISKLSSKLIKLTGEFNRCTINHCFEEKVNFMKDKDVSNYTCNSIGALKNLSDKQKEKQVKIWINNDKAVALSKCRFEKCNDITRKFMKTNMDLFMEMKNKNKKNNKINPQIKSYLDEYYSLLKLQKITDDDIKKIKKLSLAIKL